MSDFRALMALSASQTKESQSAVQQALAQRQRNEELRRKQQAEQERKEQEMARKLRLKHFEDERKERERQQRQEQEKAAREAALKRREEEAKNALLYGPKKAKSRSAPPDGAASKWPSSSSQNRVRTEVRKSRVPGEDGDDDDDGNAPEFLTREEKRERKQQLQMKRLFHSSKRPSGSANRSAGGKRRLPGGAVDVTTDPGLDAAPSNKSIRERLAKMPNTLMKLNTVKRDTRTIDEILQDRAKAKDGRVLDGDEARVFDDWFGTKKESAKKAPSSQPAAIPVATSGANTPASRKYCFQIICAFYSDFTTVYVFFFYRG
jgi:protein SPT2